MKLPIKVSLSITVIGSIFMLYIFDNIHRQLTSSQKQYSIQSSQKEFLQLNNSLDHILNRSISTLSTIAITNTKVKQTIIKQKSRFEYYMKLHNEFQSLKYISLEGKELLNVSRDTILNNISNKSYKGTTLYTKALEQDYYISDLYFESKSYKLMIDISKSIHDISNNKIEGIIIASISIDKIQELISDKLVIFDAIALLNNNNNKFIYKSSQAKLFSEDNLFKLNGVQTTSLDNDLSYLVVANNYTKDDLNLKIYLISKENTFNSEINKTIEANIKLFSIILLIFSVVVYIVINNLLKPLKKLTSDIKKLSLKYDETFQENKTNDLSEIDSLKFYFDIFINLIKKDKEKLNDFNQNLQQKVNEESEKNKLSQELLMQQSKMASMGEMLESIAHQWRQPLSVITTSASGIMLQKEYGMLTDELLESTCNNITQNADHLSQTIDDFRDFYKEDKKKLPFKLIEVTNATLALLVSKFKHAEIEIVKSIEDIEYIGFKNELIQVFMNIFNNAKDELIKKDQKRFIFIQIKQEDQNIIINIKDNAGGIPKDILPKIFDAHFTTKGEKDGTGIGLYMSKKIITSNFEGNIEAFNIEYSYNDENYKGANFKISLPIK
ncbi:MAG: sensor histidine kinase [Campylobacterota bacterium]|nr:sensor histidine kinase [Campylobacterota bacterium]